MKSTPILCRVIRMPIRVIITTLFLTVNLLSSHTAQSQCAAASLNWDYRDYLTTNGNYSGFVTAAMRDTQYFAIGKNRVAFRVPAAITKHGENATNTAHTVANTAGEDVEFRGNGTWTMTFDTVVLNLNFAIFDLDELQALAVTAVDGNGLALNITMTVGSAGRVTILGSGGTTPTATSLANADNNNDTRGTVNISISGTSPGAGNGVKRVTVTTSSGTGGTNRDIWVSKLNACVYNSFPTNYYQVARPFTGQSPYILSTSDTNTVSKLDLTSGVARQVMRDATPRYVNGLAYDPYNHIMYYVHDGSSGATNVQNNKTIRRYDFNTGAITTNLVNNVNTLGIPTFTRGVESAGSAFYDGAVYFGIEGTNSSRDSDRESIIWRINLNSAGQPTGIAQVFAMPADDGTNIQEDWGDFGIYDGILYDFSSGNGGSTSRFHHYDLQTGVITNTYNTGASLVARQTGTDWQGNMYWVWDSIAVYNNGTVGPKTRITPAQNLGDWVVHPNGCCAVFAAGDGSDPFRPKSDFGDAPASYDPDPLAPATHEVIPNLRLGNAVIDEWHLTSSPLASAESSLEEDGINGPILSLNTNATYNYMLPVRAFNNTGGNATVIGWLDNNCDGIFQASEASAVVTLPNNGSMQTFNLVWNSMWMAPTTALRTFVRIRIARSTSGLTTARPNGWILDGEVEDWPVPIGVALPNDINSFDVVKQNNSLVNVKWTINVQQQVESFDVLRSSDRISWEKIGTVAPQQGFGLQNYKFDDASPGSGTTYYRIHIKYQADGANKLSEVKSVKIANAGSSAIRLLPNPAKDRTEIQFNVSERGNATIRLYDQSGHALISLQRNVTAGMNKIALDNLTGLSAGVYTVRIELNGKVFNSKLVINSH